MPTRSHAGFRAETVFSSQNNAPGFSAEGNFNYRTWWKLAKKIR